MNSKIDCFYFFSEFEHNFRIHFFQFEKVRCLAWDLGAEIVGAETEVGGVGVSDWGISSGVGTSIGESGVSVSGVGGGGVEESIGISLTLLAPVKVGGSIAGIGDVGSGAWDGDIGSVNTGGRLEGGGGKTVCSIGIGESQSGVEECWVSLSLGRDGGHKGVKNNLKCKEIIEMLLLLMRHILSHDLPFCHKHCKTCFVPFDHSKLLKCTAIVLLKN